MTCKECNIEMKAQIVSENVTIWRCINNHKYIEHTSENRDKPYPLNFERKVLNDVR